MLDGERKQKSEAYAGSIDRSSLLVSYRRYAPVYDFLFGAVLEGGRRLLADRASALRPERLLEIGVGTGLLLRRYPSAAKIVGIDLSPQMLMRARRSARKAKLDLLPSLILGDGELLPFADASFDCVTLPYVISVTPNPNALLREAKRVCHPSGHILILNHFVGRRRWAWAERLLAPAAAQVGFRSAISLQDILASCTWKCMRVDPANLGLSSLIQLRHPDGC